MSPFVLILVGLLGLIFASEVAVAGTRRLALRFGRSPMTVGLTVAAVGTSLPEMATNVAAAASTIPGHGSGIAVGNIVGSCLSQITLLLGITACIRPLEVEWSDARKTGAAALGALLIMAVVIADGVASRREGWFLVAIYSAYLVHVWRSGAPAAPDDAPEPPSTLGPLLQAVGGMSVLVLSADLMVDNAVRLAIQMGVGEEKVGLAVGVATGLPELAFAIQGVRVGAMSLAVGNLIGSNITDPLASFGLGASIRPVEVSADVLRIDMPVWGLATVAALWLLSRPRGMRRAEGIVLVGAFVAYSIFRAAT